MYDIAIVGAGPAGATLARMLGGRYRVLLVDRRRLDLEAQPGVVTKPCGGLLAPAAQKELARQGLGVPRDVAVGPQLFAVRTTDLSANLERLYQRFYVNVDREAFDRWLVSLVPAGVERCFGWTLLGVETDGEAPSLHFRTGQDAHASVRARWVVGADGARSMVRRLACPDVAEPPVYTAIQASFDLGAADPFYGAIFDTRLTDFYCWTVPKHGSLLVGGAFLGDSGPSARFDALVRELRDRGVRFGREITRAAARLYRPARPGHLFAGRGRVLLAGEAAGFVSPSSGEGISYALRSGACLAEAFADGLLGVQERYVSLARPLAVKVGVKAAKSAAIYGSPVRRAIMRSGVGSISGDEARPLVPVAKLLTR